MLKSPRKNHHPRSKQLRRMHMRRKAAEEKRPRPETGKRMFTKVGLTAIALALIFTAIIEIKQGSMFYPNYWGGPVYSPLAIIAGSILLYIALYKV